MQRLTLSCCILTLSLSSFQSGTSSIQHVNGYIAGKTYPSFCSTGEEQSKRSIPPLLPKNSQIFADPHLYVNLQHVTVVTSEGMKVPSGTHANKCWPDYNDLSMDTSEWNCGFHSLSRATSVGAIDYLLSKDLKFGEVTSDVNVLKEATVRAGENPSFAFEKRYDAEVSSLPPMKGLLISDAADPVEPDNEQDSVKEQVDMGNILRGSCQLGQLTLRGYEQARRNGIILRNAYVKHDNARTDDENENENSNNNQGNDGVTKNIDTLYDFDAEESNVAVHDRAYDEPQLYFRSDDTQAAMMSGQALLQSFFGNLMAHHANVTDDERNAVIRVHTSDHDRDIWRPNAATCPILSEIEDAALQSDNMMEGLMDSDEAFQMMNLARNYLGGWSRYKDPTATLECIMTAVCSDRTVPYVLDIDKSKDDENLKNVYGADWFDRFVTFQTRRKSHIYKHNHGRYSEIATNPIWNDILSGLLIFTNKPFEALKRVWPDIRPKSKLALYSAHDETIMVLLSSLGPSVWEGLVHPPYASMLIIELYDVFPHVGQGGSDSSYILVDREYANGGTVFRLIHDGEVLTPKIAGCPDSDELCNIEVLVAHVFEFSNVTKWDDLCQWDDSIQIPEDQGESGREPDGLDEHEGPKVAKILGFIVLGIFSAVCGALSMFLFMNRKLRLHSNSVSGERNFLQGDVKISHDVVIT